MALARALAVEPTVLLLDEPFGALDAKVRKELRDWLRRLHDEVHVTTVFVTHDQEEALEVADEIVVINDGRIEQVGSPDELYDEPANDFVMSFLGPVTRLDGELVRPHDIDVFTAERRPGAVRRRGRAAAAGRLRGAAHRASGVVGRRLAPGPVRRRRPGARRTTSPSCSPARTPASSTSTSAARSGSPPTPAPRTVPGDGARDRLPDRHRRSSRSPPRLDGVVAWLRPRTDTYL